MFKFSKKFHFLFKFQKKFFGREDVVFDSSIKKKLKKQWDDLNNPKKEMFQDNKGKQMEEVYTTSSTTNVLI